MSNEDFNELSDDFSQWPESYWDWFGLIAEQASLSDLRHAYSRLIKRFRPETFPDHFQKIQNAFETLRTLIQSGKSRTNSSSDSEQNGDIPDLKLDQNAKDEDLAKKALEKKKQEFLDSLFELIHARQFPQAIEMLRETIKIESETGNQLDEIPYLYLYWTMYCTQSDTSDKDLISLLLEGDRISHQDELSTCIRTFFSWLERTPLADNNDLYEYIFDSVPEKALSAVLNVKWNHLSFQKDVDDIDAIEADLAKMKKKLLPGKSNVWLTILIESMEHLLWTDESRSEKVIQTVREQIDGLSEYHEELEQSLDNLDRLEELIKSMRAIPRVVPLNFFALEKVLFCCWNMPFARYRIPLLLFIAEQSDDVLKSFMVYDYLQLNHQIILSQLDNPMAQLFLSRHPELEDLPDSQLQQQIDGILKIWKANHENYGECRLKLLQYFLKERLYPRKILERMISQFLAMENDEKLEKLQDEFNKILDPLFHDIALRITYYSVMNCELDDMD